MWPVAVILDSTALESCRVVVDGGGWGINKCPSSRKQQDQRPEILGNDYSAMWKVKS